MQIIERFCGGKGYLNGFESLQSDKRRKNVHKIRTKTMKQKKKDMDKNKMIVLKSIINFGNKNNNLKIKLKFHVTLGKTTDKLRCLKHFTKELTQRVYEGM